MKLERQYDQATIGIFTPYLVDVIFEESRQISIAFPLGLFPQAFPNTSFFLVFFMHFFRIAF